MRISVRIDSKAAQAQLRRWGGEFRQKVKKAAARGIASEAAQLKQNVRSHVAGRMTVVKKSFVKGFTAKVLDKDTKRLPALYVGSRIPWSGMHERGGVIGGRMLIPLHGRVGRKRFKAQIAELMRVFLPDGTNEARLIDQVDSTITKVVELGYLRKLKPAAGATQQAARYEVRRILKAFVDAQWLADFDVRLEGYRTTLSGADRDKEAGR